MRLFTDWLNKRDSRYLRNTFIVEQDEDVTLPKSKQAKEKERFERNYEKASPDVRAEFDKIQDLQKKLEAVYGTDKSKPVWQDVIKFAIKDPEFMNSIQFNQREKDYLQSQAKYFIFYVNQNRSVKYWEWLNPEHTKLSGLRQLRQSEIPYDYLRFGKKPYAKTAGPLPGSDEWKNDPEYQDTVRQRFIEIYGKDWKKWTRPAQIAAGFEKAANQQENIEAYWYALFTKEDVAKIFNDRTLPPRMQTISPKHYMSWDLPKRRAAGLAN
jgi:hypothetical protein